MRFGLPAEYDELTDHEKVRELLGVPRDAPDSQVVARLEALVDNRMELQSVVIETTRMLRQCLADRGFDDLARPSVRESV